MKITYIVLHYTAFSSQNTQMHCGFKFPDSTYSDNSDGDDDREEISMVQINLRNCPTCKGVYANVIQYYIERSWMSPIRIRGISNTALRGGGFPANGHPAVMELKRFQSLFYIEGDMICFGGNGKCLPPKIQTKPIDSIPVSAPAEDVDVGVGEIADVIASADVGVGASADVGVGASADVGVGASASYAPTKETISPPVPVQKQSATKYSRFANMLKFFGWKGEKRQTPRRTALLDSD